MDSMTLCGLPNEIRAFCETMQSQWQANDLAEWPTAFDLGERSVKPLHAQIDAFEVYIFERAARTHLPQRLLKPMLDTLNDGLVLILYEDGLLDGYAKSPISHEVVPALDVRWRGNSHFWQLGRSTSLMGATVQLELYFGKQKIQRAFVAKFKQCLEKLAVSWQGLNQNDAMIGRKLAFDTLLRLLFLAFLQSKAILDGRTNFLLEEAAATQARGGNIYDDFIQPFYFGTLNVPANTRNARAKAFGKIPFLNGGLFQPTVEEIENPHRTVDNAVFFGICESILGDWEFTDHETHHADSALDPMMLGHVFEMLMPRSLRAQTGSFYTPMNLVRDVTHRAMSNWLERRCGLTSAAAEALIDQGLTTTLSDSDIEQVLSALTQARILDLSAGSGAFLQEASTVLHRAISALHTRLGSSVAPAELARDILLNNIFGVDILEPANRICELRLWLTTLQYYQTGAAIPPLPNLDMNIRCGHALIDLTQYAMTLGIDATRLTNAQSAALRAQYGRANGREKQQLAQSIETLDHAVEQHLVETLKTTLQAKIHDIQSAFPAKNLFGETNVMPFNTRQALQALQAHLNALESKHLNGTFSFDVHYAEVMREGGFDIILGNPPWYSLHTRDCDEQATLRRLYQTAQKPDQQPNFTNQSMDISALFVEKSLQVTRPGGVVAMLLPNKLFNAPSYERFRQYVAVHAETVDMKDWSALSPFDAATYPADVILMKRHAPYHANTGWLTDHDAVRSVLLEDTPLMRNVASDNTLQSHFTLKRGLRTSANDLFLCRLTESDAQTGISQVQVASEAEPVSIETSQLYPIIRGTDIRPFHVTIQHHLILTHTLTDLSKPMTDLPALTQKWFQRHQTRLSSRSGIRRGPYTAIFGASQCLRRPKVVWRDIGRMLSAVFEPREDVFVLNTAYYIPVADERMGYLLSGFLNSTPIREYCQKRAEYARGGYRRFFAWLIGEIPWTFDQAFQNSALGERIIAISKEAHAMATSLGIPLRLQTQLDHCVLRAMAQQGAKYE